MRDENDHKYQRDHCLAIQDPGCRNIGPSHQHEEHERYGRHKDHDDRCQRHISGNDKNNDEEKDRYANQFEVGKAYNCCKCACNAFASPEFQIKWEYMPQDHACTSIKDQCMEIDGILRKIRENDGRNVNCQESFANITDKCQDTPTSAQYAERICGTIITAAVIPQVFFLDFRKNECRLNESEDITSGDTIQ